MKLIVCQLLFVYFQMDLLQTDRRQISDYFGITGHAPRVSSFLYLQILLNLYEFLFFSTVIKYGKLGCCANFNAGNCCQWLFQWREVRIERWIDHKQYKGVHIFPPSLLLSFLMLNNNRWKFKILKWYELFTCSCSHLHWISWRTS